MSESKHRSIFPRFASWASVAVGKPLAFVLAVTVVVLWAISGPLFQFNDTWQLAINTGTTIVTFLMVFLIQNSQNRDGRAIQVKLDELIRSIAGAENSALDLEKVDPEQLDKLEKQYQELAQKARSAKTQKAVNGQPTAPS